VLALRVEIGGATEGACLSYVDFLAKWRAERDRLSRYRVLVDPIPLLDDILQDAAAALASDQDELLTLEEARASSGYSVDHLARLVRQGTIPDLRLPGRRGRIYIRRRDLPVRPGRPHTEGADVHELASGPARGKEGHDGHP